MNPQQQTDQHVTESSDSNDIPGDENIARPILMLRVVLGWVTPYEQMLYLRRKRDSKAWERFRDSLMRRWSNLNVICGLIMGAVSSIVFADLPLSRASFSLGIISLLSSLIAIGFGVGLIYVLGDVKGISLLVIDQNYPRLYLFALSIPEVWAFISFGTFFADIGVIVWQSADKGWIVKAGTAVTAVALVGHLVAFAILFREQDTTEYLIPDRDVIVSDTPVDDVRDSKEEYKGKARAEGLDGLSRKQRRPGMAPTPLRSSQTLVARPILESCRAPICASTTPESLQRSLDAFVVEPAVDIATVTRASG